MGSRRGFLGLGVGVAALAMMPLAMAQATQGVSKNEIVIGSILDLSGPLASLGKPLQNGMTMRVEQINERGGIHGRKLRLQIEDSGYDPKKAVLAAQKLLTQDKIFAMLGSLGTVVSLPTIPLALERNVAHLFPVTAHHGNYEPFHKLKFAFATSYPAGTRLAILELMKTRNYKRVGILYQDDEFGLDVLRGTEMALKELNLPLIEKTSYKRGATEFLSQAQKLKAANLDLIVLGTVVRETIGAMATARQMGYTGDFLGSEAAYMPVVAKAGGKAVEGLFAVNETPNPYRDDPKNPVALNEWMDAFKARFNEDAELWAASGWLIIDLFVRAAEKAGPNLTTDALVKSLETHNYPRTFLGNPEFKFSPTNRLGNNQVRISQIQNGRWVVVSDFLK